MLHLRVPTTTVTVEAEWNVSGVKHSEVVHVCMIPCL